MSPKPLFTLIFLYSATALLSAEPHPPAPKPVDPTVTEQTINLLLNLHRIGWRTDKIIFGQEFPLSYTRSMQGITDPTTSDVKDVTGDHPGLQGYDFHYFIDKDPHERVAHTIAAKAAYQAGALVTFDYHWLGKYGNSHNWHKEDAKILAHVVNNDDSRGDVTWFYQSLDKVLKIVNEDLQFPIVFRPLHEMNGKWFWWGSRLDGGPETYRRAYQLIVEYMSERTDYLLFAWSPDKSLATDYYPGDAYVDIIGIDGYGAGNPEINWFTVDKMVAVLEETVDFAAAHGKVAAFTETGYGTHGEIDYHKTQPDWWTRSILEPILASEKASRIAWIQTWINADWSGPYTPSAASPDTSKTAFKAFHNHPSTLFEKDVAAEKIYAPIDN